ncbi:Guanidinoacetate N-methyltransferase [Durusdinium trenchii]
MLLNCPNEQYKEIYTESPTHFHAFLDIALQYHSRRGSRISGYLVSPIVVDRDDVEITYGSFDVHPPEHCNYYFRNEAVVPVFSKTEIHSEASTRSPSPEECAEQ